MAAACVVATLAAGCGSAASPTPLPLATAFPEYREAFCLAWDSLFAAVGNPDTGEGSTLSDGFEQAIAVGDLDRADRLALEMRAEIVAARRHVAFATGWEPGASLMLTMDRILAAFDASIEARRVAAPLGSQVAGERAQSALEAAGGLEAWQALMTPGTWQAIDAARPPGTESQTCPNVPIGL